MLTKVDDWVEFSSQSWIVPLLLGRLEESCPVFFVLWVLAFVFISTYCFIEVKEKLIPVLLGKKDEFL